MVELFFYLLVLFAIAALMQVDFLFSILYLFFGVVVFSRLWARRALAHVRIERRYHDRAFLGEVVPVTLRVHNTSRLPLIWLQVHESLPIDLISPNFFRQVVSLGPRGQADLGYALRCRRRGYYTLGPLTMATSDLFGFEENTARWSRDEHMTVYPEIVPLGKIGLPSVSPFVSLPSGPRLFEDPARVIGVRDYYAGDSPRHINWKTSAAVGTLLVKKYEPAIALDTMIFLDLYRPGYDTRTRYWASELAIVAAASIANHLTERRQSVGLTTNGLDPLGEETTIPRPLPTHHGRAHLMHILDILARVEVADTQPVTMLLSRQRPELPWGATLLIIAGRESEGLLDAILSARHAGFPVVLVLTDDSAPLGPVEQQHEMLSVPVYRLSVSDDLKTLFEL
ncbi:MAG: DUF58 domain-containing protein [Anaerolineae bacterium]